MLSEIAKQLHCPNSVLKGLLQKRLGKEDYFKELLKAGQIKQEEYANIGG